MPIRKAPRHNSPLPFFSFLFAVILILTVFRFLHNEQLKKQNAAATPTSAPAPASEDPIAPDHITFGGEPRPGSPDISFTLLKNIAYEVGYSEQRKDPLWSAYHVIHLDNPYILKRPSGNFLTDERTLAKTTHHDFTGSGYDRGHMTPNSAIARFYGAEAQRETFLLSNICPQSPNLNREVWAKLEMDITDYTSQFDEIWVTCGPIFADMNGGITHTLRSGIAIPSSFYKIAVEDQSGKIRLFSAIMPQGVKGTELPQQFLTSVRQIEDQTGLEFLWKLDPQTCATLENQVYPLW